MRFSLLSEVSIQSVTILFSFNNRKEVEHYRGNLVFEYFFSGSERRHHHSIYVQDKKEVRIISDHYIYVSGKVPSYPSPQPTLTFTSHFWQNVGLGEGEVGSFPETYNDEGRTGKHGEVRAS